jgi:hypothetical protein
MESDTGLRSFWELSLGRNAFESWKLLDRLHSRSKATSRNECALRAGRNLIRRDHQQVSPDGQSNEPSGESCEAPMLQLLGCVGAGAKTCAATEFRQHGAIFCQIG